MELDRWLEDHSVNTATTRRMRIREWIGQPVDWARDFAAFTRTSPGTMFMLILTISLILLAAGVVQFESAANRRSSIATVSSVTEPVAFSAHDLYTSLSIADAQAMGALVQQDPDVSNYRDALYRASLAATESAAGAQRADRTLVDIGTVTMYLPVYSGLIEAGRSFDRMDNPLGSAYMGQASALMRERMMPAADSLFTATSQRVIDEQAANTRPHIIPFLLLLAGLIVLIPIQMWFYHLTRRRFNRGFLVATGLVAVCLVWGGVVQIVAWTAGTADIDSYTQLTQARITTQRLRADEVLGLVRRADLTTSSSEFDSSLAGISATLDAIEARTDDPGMSDSLAAAHTALTEWSDFHQQVVAATRAGDYTGATTIMAVDSASPVSRVDSILETLIGISRTHARDTITTSYNANFLLGPGTLALCIIAILALWIGVRPRLQEYL
ncbi:MAG: hypothetical protein SPI77_01335 [Corynebacterium sp.]|nr:hypothetical protein [Corynebacterium sp.]